MDWKRLVGGFNEQSWAEHYEQALGLAQRGRLELAVESMKKAIECATRPGGDERLVESYVGLGNIHLGMGKFGLAEQAYTQAVDVARHFRGPQDRMVAGALTFLANCHEEQGRYDLAAQRFGEAIEILESQPPGEGASQLLTNTRANLATVLANLGKGAEALALNQRVVDAERQNGNPAELSVALWSRSTIASRQGMHDEAIQAAGEALALADRWNGRDSVQVLQAVHQYGNILVKAGRAAEVIPIFEEGLPRLRASGAQEPILEATWMESLADALLAVGRFEDSEQWYQRSLEAFIQLHGPLHQNLLSGIEGYCELLRRQGREADLRELERRLKEIQAALPPELVRRNSRK